MGLSILLLIQSFETGGAQRQLIQLADGLRDRGCNVSVGVFYNSGGLAVELQRTGVPIVDLGKAGRWENFRFLNRLRETVRKLRPDIIYSFLGGANIAAAVLRPVAPKTRLVWSIRASDMDLSHYDWFQKLTYKLECLVSRAADLIIANSYAGRDFAVAHGVPRDRIVVVPNGVDTDRFRPDQALRSEQRAEWGLGDDQIAIGVLARLDPMKGHASFLRAAAKVHGLRGDVRFLFIGAGPEQRELMELAATLGLADVVAFTGMTEDPVRALNGLDICCSPSAFGEGFSNAIAEAMACGIPVIATDVGDSARIVGGAGLVVPRSDDSALAAAMLSAIEGDRRMGADGRRRIADNFSIDAMVERTLELLRGDVGAVEA